MEKPWTKIKAATSSEKYKLQQQIDFETQYVF